MPIYFQVIRNNFLRLNTVGYFHCYYTGYGQLGNPEYLNTLKNTFNNTGILKLKQARNKVVDILLNDIPRVLEDTGIEEKKELV